MWEDAQRYWRSNSLDDEGVRLRLLEEIADGRTQRLLSEAGIAEGWRCAELGAGAGSVARWMADRVGASGSVLAVDVDISLLDELKDRSNVVPLRADLETADLPPASVDLVHTRNVLMHLERRQAVLDQIVSMLGPGGVVVLEEADGFPAEAATNDVFRRTFAPLTRRWTWARRLPGLMEDAGLSDIGVFVETEMLQGGTALAAFWHYTLGTARELVLRVDPTLSEDDVDQTLGLLRDPSFWTPFMAVVCITARKPS